MNKTNFNTILTDKSLRFLLYDQEMLVNMNFWLAEIFYPKKNLLEEAAAIKRFEYSLLGEELVKEISVAEKQYKNS